MIYRTLLSHLLKLKDFIARFYHFSPASFDDVSSFIVKFGYNACCHWLKEIHIWPTTKLVLCPSISQTSLLLFFTN